MNFKTVYRAAAVAIVLSAFQLPAHADISLLNVSYDPTRELYQDYNAAFARHWKATNNEVVTVRQALEASEKTYFSRIKY